MTRAAIGLIRRYLARRRLQTDCTFPRQQNAPWCAEAFCQNTSLSWTGSLRHPSLGGHLHLQVGLTATHVGEGDSKLILAATPLLLLLQLVLLSLYPAFILGNDSGVVISIGPFVEAFVVLIALPLVLAVPTAAGAKRSRVVQGWDDA